MHPPAVQRSNMYGPLKVMLSFLRTLHWNHLHFSRMHTYFQQNAQLCNVLLINKEFHHLLLYSTYFCSIRSSCSLSGCGVWNDNTSKQGIEHCNAFCYSYSAMCQLHCKIIKSIFFSIWGLKSKRFLTKLNWFETNTSIIAAPSITESAELSRKGFISMETRNCTGDENTGCH